MTKKTMLLLTLISLLYLILLSLLSIGTALILYPLDQQQESNVETETQQPDTTHDRNKEASDETEEEREEPSFDTQALQSDIEQILAEEQANYAVYIKGLKSEMELGINEEELLFPGSIYKVPIAILVLRDIEQGKYTLDSTIMLKEENKMYSYDAIAQNATGTYHTIDKLLKYMIWYSDNTAWDMLQDNMGTTAQLDKRFEEELELKYTRKIPFQSTARETGEILEGIYSYRYLNSTHSEYLLEMMSNITESQNDRIPAGVPEGTRVAHKIGNWTGIWEDAGIVYGDAENFIIVVLNRNTTISNAQYKTSEISKLTWEYFNGEIEPKVKGIGYIKENIYLPSHE